MSDQDSGKNLIFINSHCSCIEFKGENCDDFLNNLLITDLKSLNENKFYYTALCNPKGRIISSLWIRIVDDEKIHLICPTNMEEELLKFFTLRKFRLKIDIALDRRSIAIDQTGEITTDLEFPKTDVNIYIFYDILFKLNLPWINQENTEKFIPQHVNLDQHEDIMSFTKGCYPGQEIIARMKFLGKIKKRMKVITYDSKDKLIDNLDSKNQVSPIIVNSHGMFSAQVIEKISASDIDEE
jgi:folate-binding protein YgfZ